MAPLLIVLKKMNLWLPSCLQPEIFLGSEEVRAGVAGGGWGAMKGVKTREREHRFLLIPMLRRVF